MRYLRPVFGGFAKVTRQVREMLGSPPNGELTVEELMAREAYHAGFNFRMIYGDHLFPGFAILKGEEREGGGGGNIGDFIYIMQEHGNGHLIGDLTHHEMDSCGLTHEELQSVVQLPLAISSVVDPEYDDPKQIVAKVKQGLAQYDISPERIERYLTELGAIYNEGIDINDMRVLLAAHQADWDPRLSRDKLYHTTGTSNDLVWCYTIYDLGGVTKPDSEWQNNNGDLPHNCVVMTYDYIDVIIAGVRMRIPVQSVNPETGAFRGLTSPTAAKQRIETVDLSPEGGHTWHKVRRDIGTGGQWFADATEWAKLFLPNLQADEEGKPSRPSQVYIEVDPPGEQKPERVALRGLVPAPVRTRA